MERRVFGVGCVSIGGLMGVRARGGGRGTGSEWPAETSSILCFLLLMSDWLCSDLCRRCLGSFVVRAICRCRCRRC